MPRTTTPVIGSIVLALLGAAAALFIMRAGQGDVDVCRGILRGLAEGKASVKQRIDWHHLKALDVDVGATYAKLPSDQERAKYRQAFVESFARGFKHTGGTVSGFRRWRIQERRNGRVVVAADYEAKQKVLLMTIPASGPKKLEALQWQ